MNSNALGAASAVLGAVAVCGLAGLFWMLAYLSVVLAIAAFAAHSQGN